MTDAFLIGLLIMGIAMGSIGLVAGRERDLKRKNKRIGDIATLFAQAKAAFDALTPDEQIHHRHEQRISFVVGNVGLSRPDMSRADLEAGARRAAGPCPCARCSTRGEPYR